MPHSLWWLPQEQSFLTTDPFPQLLWCCAAFKQILEQIINLRTSFPSTDIFSKRRDQRFIATCHLYWSILLYQSSVGGSTRHLGGSLCRNTVFSLTQVPTILAENRALPWAVDLQYAQPFLCNFLCKLLVPLCEPSRSLFSCPAAD